MASERTAPKRRSKRTQKDIARAARVAQARQRGGYIAPARLAHSRTSLVPSTFGLNTSSCGFFEAVRARTHAHNTHPRHHFSVCDWRDCLARSLMMTAAATWKRTVAPSSAGANDPGCDAARVSVRWHARAVTAASTRLAQIRLEELQVCLCVNARSRIMSTVRWCASIEGPARASRLRAGTATGGRPWGRRACERCRARCTRAASVLSKVRWLVSTQRTSRRARTQWDPVKPAAPVTHTVGSFCSAMMWVMFTEKQPCDGGSGGRLGTGQSAPDVRSRSRARTALAL
jgi:hypothetical protein